MTMKRETGQDFWDADYRQKGRLYGGSPRQLPAFPAGTRVLELGCGDGKSLSAMIAHGWDVTAIDFSSRAIQLAREVAGKGTGAALAVADAGTLPFPARVFDAVVAIHILGHSDEEGRTRIAQEIFRVIRPGGWLWFACFSQQDFRYGNGMETEPGTYLRGNGIPNHYFTDEEVSGLFSGFVVESLQRVEWVLRVRGKEHPRSEIEAVFRKD